MNYGNTSNAAASSVSKNNSISNAISDFDPCLDRAAQYASRLQSLCDRLVGPRPTEVGKPTQDTPPLAVLSSIHECRSRLMAILDNIEGALQILDNSI
jgi:hypothetical protein